MHSKIEKLLDKLQTHEHKDKVTSKLRELLLALTDKNQHSSEWIVK